MPLALLNVICLVSGGLRGALPVTVVSRPGKKTTHGPDQAAKFLPSTESALAGLAS